MAWEHRMVKVDYAPMALKYYVRWHDGSKVDLDDALAAISADGWEIVASAPGMANGHLLYLKRPLE